MAKANFIRYQAGGEDFAMAGEEVAGTVMEGAATALKECDEKTRNRLGNIRDMVRGVFSFFPFIFVK